MLESYCRLHVHEPYDEWMGGALSPSASSSPWLAARLEQSARTRLQKLSQQPWFFTECKCVPMHGPNSWFCPYATHREWAALSPTRINPLAPDYHRFEAATAAPGFPFWDRRDQLMKG